MKYRLSFNGDIQQKQCNALRDRIATVLEQKDFEDITVLFSSPGGSTSEAIAIFNFVRSLPVKIQMHAVGAVESASVPVFLSADMRSCAPFARFYLHQYTWNFGGPQPEQTLKRGESLLQSDIIVSKSIIRSRTTIPPEMLDVLDGDSEKQTIFGPDDAKRLGIVSDIVDFGATIGTDKNVAIWTVNWPP